MQLCVYVVLMIAFHRTPWHVPLPPISASASASAQARSAGARARSPEPWDLEAEGVFTKMGSKMETRHGNPTWEPWVPMGTPNGKTLWVSSGSLACG